MLGFTDTLKKRVYSIVIIGDLVRVFFQDNLLMALTALQLMMTIVFPIIISGESSYLLYSHYDSDTISFKNLGMLWDVYNGRIKIKGYND